MTDSVFTKIIKGEIPCHKVYEDDRVIAFLDIFPDEEGHTLVVPKKQVDKIYDLDDDDYIYLWLTAKKLALYYEKYFGLRIILNVIGIDVPHAHIHLVPYNPKNHSSQTEYQNTKMSKEPDHTALAALAKKLAF